MKKFFKYILNKILFIPKLLYGIIIFKLDVYKINKELYTANENLFNELSLCNSIVRKIWLNKPDIPKEDYIYSPCIDYNPEDYKEVMKKYNNKEEFEDALYNYVESDESFKRRIMKKHEIRKSNK